MTASVGMVVALTVMSIVFAVLFRVLLMLAVNFDCRARNLKSTSLFTVLTLFFPVITGIVYASVRDRGEVNKKACTVCRTEVDGAAKQCPQCLAMTFEPVLPRDSAGLAKMSARLFIVSVLIFAIGACAGVARTVMAADITKDINENYSDEDIQKSVDDFLEEYSKKQEQSTATEETTEGKTTAPVDGSTTDAGDVLSNLTYYDRNGKAYKNQYDVPFYDKDGNIYLRRSNRNLQTWFVKEGTRKKIDSSKCFVDTDGYFVYDKNGDIKLDKGTLSAKDKNGKKYIPADIALWNKDGKMLILPEN